jgi:transglutaminase-like putative cysteine protease
VSTTWRRDPSSLDAGPELPRAGEAVPAPSGGFAEAGGTRLGGSKLGAVRSGRTALRLEPGEGSARTEVALAALTFVALLGFHRVFSGGAWVIPVVGTALVVQVVCRLTRRWVSHPLLGGLIDLSSIGVLVSWTVVPSSTFFGLPAAGTWRAISDSLAGIGARMQDATVPAHPATGFLVLAAAGSGLVALAGSWLSFRLDRTLDAAVPSFAAFVACCCLGTRAGRGWAIALELAAIGTFTVIRRTDGLDSARWFASRASRAKPRTLRSALPQIAAAVIVAVAVVPLLPGSDGHGVLGWRQVGADAPRIVISPLVSLSTRLLHQSSTNVFTVRSTVPSYWRLTSLDYFDGNEWNARDTYQDVDQKLPGVTAGRRGSRVVHEQFDIQNLDSVWLPLAFDPETVTGAGKVSYDARSGSLLTPRPTSNNLRYSVTSLQYLDTLSPPDLRAAPALTRTSALAPYLQLPASVPANVRALAARIVAGKRTEYGKAYALEQFFYGPSFTYSLQPPADGSGDVALETFLFQTRTGYCQQFAGSFAVLARAVGLPTRLAIGFTTGQQRSGIYQVTDADAHTWPEVWFPSFGWVPFEPTKGSPGSGFAIPGATAYTGDTAATRPSTGVSPAKGATTAPTVPSPTKTNPVVRSGTASTPIHAQRGGASGKGGGQLQEVTARPETPVAATHHHGGRALGVVGLLLAALGLLVASNAIGRRCRWALRRHRAFGRPGPNRRYGADAVRVVWEETAEQLAWHGIRRRTAETPREFADRVAAQRRSAEELPLGAHLARLAEILAEADFSMGPVAAADIEEALLRGRRLASILERDRHPPQRLRLWLDPRVAWAPATIEPSKGVWLDVTVG